VKVKFTLLLLIFNLGLMISSITQVTTIRGVVVSFTVTNSIFPGSWQVAPVHAQGQAIDSSEITRCKQTLIRAFSKYPDQLLKNNLNTVYFLKSMSFYGIGYGGTNFNGTVYLTNDGLSNGYTDHFLEQTFHHEFSSILYRNYPALLDTIAWKKSVITGFGYSDPEDGVGAIRNNKSSQEIEPTLCAKGFLTQYALSGMENDINTLAQNLFCPSAGFWNTVEKFSLLSKKVKLLMKFYHSLDSHFTESFFRDKINK